MTVNKTGLDETGVDKLGINRSVLVGLSRRCQFFLESPHSQIAVFEVKCVFWPIDWN